MADYPMPMVTFLFFAHHPTRVSFRITLIRDSVFHCRPLPGTCFYSSYCVTAIPLVTSALSLVLGFYGCGPVPMVYTDALSDWSCRSAEATLGNPWDSCSLAYVHLV
jgi:hypothetical protein